MTYLKLNKTKKIMPILDNELNGNISNRDYTQERVDLSSINGPMPGRLPNLVASYSPGYSGDPW